MELKERLNYILKNNTVKPNISEYEFARSVGTYPTKFAEIRSGKVKTLSQDIALEISNLYNVDFKWLLTGEGSMTGEYEDYYKLPIRLDVKASLGDGLVVYNEQPSDYFPITKQFALMLGIEPNKSEIIFASGNSMEPTIEGGDSLLVDLSKTEIHDGRIYCIRYEGQLYAKRLQKLPPNKIKVISDNFSQYDAFYIDFSNELDFDFKIIGEVRWWGRIAK